MKTAFRPILILLPCIFAGSVSAETYHIRAGLDNTTKGVTYKHTYKANETGTPDRMGRRGHQIVQDGDTIVWRCWNSASTSCSSVTVAFKDDARPCKVLDYNASNKTTTCTVDQGNVDLEVYKYTVTVNANDQDYRDDPDVIVDSGKISIDKGKKKKALKK
jgi:hypothetical protein